MPWNDTSKPAEPPGPWDPPAGTPGEGAPGTPGPGNRAEPRARRPTAPLKPQPPAASPWEAERPEPPSPVRRRAGPGDPRRPATPPPARGPHLDELQRQLRDGLARAALRPSSRRARLGVILGGVVGLAAGWAASGLYSVAPGEMAVVTRLDGTVSQAGPGLHYHWPAPFGAATQLSPGAIHRLDLGSSDPGDAAERLLTRDGDLLSIAYTLEWRVADPRRYLLGLADPQATVRQAAIAGVRRAVAATSLSDLLASGRGGMADRAAALVQGKLDQARAGVSVVSVQVREVQPPDSAQGAFHDLSAASSDAQVGARDAGAYRERVLAEARADAVKAVQTSQGYRDQEISEAKGEAARFALVDAQYRKAPQVTRDRLYTETMERVLHNTPKVIVQLPKGAAAQIVLPPEAVRPKPDMPPAPTAPPAAPASSSPTQAPSSSAPDATAA